MAVPIPGSFGAQAPLPGLQLAGQNPLQPNFPPLGRPAGVPAQHPAPPPYIQHLIATGQIPHWGSVHQFPDGSWKVVDHRSGDAYNIDFPMGHGAHAGLMGPHNNWLGPLGPSMPRP